MKGYTTFAIGDGMAFGDFVLRSLLGLLSQYFVRAWVHSCSLRMMILTEACPVDHERWTACFRNCYTVDRDTYHFEDRSTRYELAL